MYLWLTRGRCELRFISNDHPGVYNCAENLAFGYKNGRDPFDGWYTEEKENYDTQNGKETGHYLNIISDYNVTGFAFPHIMEKTGANPCADFSDILLTSSNAANMMSFEDYYNRFMNYYNDLMSAPEQAQSA